ncbi:MAG: Asp-tRNA(Asn)/Glu-tRNA(Gln) amidotransferase subunit GatC [Anaerolineaceae bacterium]|nr:Asp-tRNA(Asn)/Glu-tRNA(Gln) amidotransferase subunit GatC [Anaerolineaceae bacterium]
MELTREAVREIAALARLDLDESEVALFAKQLSACLDHFRMLQGVDTDHVEPTASVLPLRNVLREDEAGAALTAEEVIANAPDADEGQFRVSAVLED